MDICSKKGIIVTCCKDKSIYFWNYLERHWLFMKYFLEEPLRYNKFEVYFEKQN